MSLQVTQTPTTVKFHIGSFLSEDENGAIESTLDTLDIEKLKKVVVDFSSTEKVNADGMCNLVRIFLELETKSVKTSIINASTDLKRTFKTMKLAQFLNFKN